MKWAVQNILASTANRYWWMDQGIDSNRPILIPILIPMNGHLNRCLRYECWAWGKIGLAKFLYSRKVPGFETVQCRCGAGYETPQHMVLSCIEEMDRRNQLTDPAGRKWSYPQLIGDREAVKSFTRWMMCSGRLGQFELAKRLLFYSE